VQKLKTDGSKTLPTNSKIPHRRGNLRHCLLCCSMMAILKRDD
jgi:hypothetical protein